MGRRMTYAGDLAVKRQLRYCSDNTIHLRHAYLV